LGHDVFFVEKADYANACFDPVRNVMSDECTYGIAVGAQLLKRFDLADRWCFVDAAGSYHGMDRTAIGQVFGDADLFIDMGTHGAWLEEAQASGRRVLIDGEPGFNQIKMLQKLEAGQRLDRYDMYFTNGLNLGTARSAAPTAGLTWGHIVHPVVMDMWESVMPPAVGAPFTTLMNWQSHEPVQFRDVAYGQKDVEFQKFVGLPRLMDSPPVVAVSGPSVPIEHLRDEGWIVQSGKEVAASYDSFRQLIARSCGEFTVCKNVFVALRTGWFSDRSAAYLASGRPVVMQDTGFSSHLPTGEGLFAVEDVDGAAAAMEEIQRRPEFHQMRAREIANDHFDAKIVLNRVIDAAASRGSSTT
ncbi:MAG: hypothetical protein HKN91_17695, partial [Acidimicrobiia bacterium]|nr:hypothetical protein [Acidimicrobiia bacterium]